MMKLRSQSCTFLVLFGGSFLFAVLVYLPFFNLRMRLLQLSPMEKVDHHILYRKWMAAKNISYVNSANKFIKKPVHVTVVRESDYLRKALKLLCAVIVKNDEHNFSDAISKTWGSRCSKTLYFSTKILKSIPTDDQMLVLSSKDIESWTALREISQYLYRKQDLKDYQWFYFVSEKSYVIVENLVYYLIVCNSHDMHYLGHLMTSFLVNYNALGTGFVLSQMALHKLNNALIKGQCANSRSAGDVAMGSCLAGLGVAPTDTRDHAGRGRFLMYPPESLLVPGLLLHAQKFWDNSVYQYPEGPGCCSDNAISFYNMDVNKIYVMEYLVNHLRPYHSDDAITRA